MTGAENKFIKLTPDPGIARPCSGKTRVGVKIVEKKERTARILGGLKLDWGRRSVALVSLVLMVVVTVAGLFYLASDWTSPRYQENEEFWGETAPEEPAPLPEVKPAPAKQATAPEPSQPGAPKKENSRPESQAAKPERQVGTAEPGPEPAEPLQPVLAPGQVFRDLALPVAAEVTSPFGWRKHPVFADWRFHPGVDLNAPAGTEVKAVLAGTVAEVKEDEVLGKVVVIDHGEKRQSRYGHLEKVSVEAGQAVQRGQVIGTVGESGISAEPHLHFELRLDKEAIDPTPYLPVSGKTPTSEDGSGQ